MTISNISVRKTTTHFSFVEFDESVFELTEVVTYAGVVSEGEQGVGVCDGSHTAQTRLPALLIPVNELQLRSQSTENHPNRCYRLSKLITKNSTIGFIERVGFLLYIFYV